VREPIISRAHANITSIITGQDTSISRAGEETVESTVSLAPQKLTGDLHWTRYPPASVTFVPHLTDEPRGHGREWQRLGPMRAKTFAKAVQGTNFR
jgi:hypothetical protein